MKIKDIQKNKKILLQRKQSNNFWGQIYLKEAWMPVQFLLNSYPTPTETSPCIE